MRPLFETPEEFYEVLMQLRASGIEPPFVFIFPNDERVKGFLDQCSPEDLARVVQDDVHLVIEHEGEFYRFMGLDNNRSTFETPPEPVH